MKIMRAIVWVILILGTIFVFQVYENTGFGLKDLIDPSIVIPIILVVLPVLVLYFTSNKFVPNRAENIKSNILVTYLLLALGLIAFMLNALMHI